MAETRRTDDVAALTAKTLSWLDAASSAAGHAFQPTTIALEAIVDGDLAGGLVAEVLYDWVYVKFLAVAPEARGAGTGAGLVRQLEALSAAEGRLGIAVDTYAYQAPSFYAGLGYAEIARLPGRRPALDRVYFSKPLANG